MASSDQLLDKGKQLLAQTQAQGGKQFSGSSYDTSTPAAAPTTTPTKPDPVLNSEALTNEPALKLPELPPATAGAGAQGFFDSFITTQKARIKAQQDIADAAKTEQNTSRTTLNETMASLLNVPSQQARLENKADIAGKTQKVTDYTNELEAEQLALRRKAEKIRKNESGLFGRAVEDEVGRVERESLSKQADLALLQSAANRDLLTAQSIIDHKISLITEPLKQKLEFDKFFYEDNKDTFTKAEDRAFNLQVSSDAKALDHAETELKSVHDAFTTAAQNGAPDSVLRAILTAKDSNSALSAAGQYMTNPLDQEIKRQQLQKLRNENAPAGDKVLSVDEAIKLGVPYGTTESQAAGLAGQASKAAAEQERKVVEGNVANINSLKKNAGLATAVGPNSGARVSFTEKFTSRRANFVAGIEQLTGQLTLDKLIASKQAGATFGALSIPELTLLSNSASKINKWAIHKNPLDPTSPVVGYNTTETEFQKELDTIQSFMSRTLEAPTPEENDYLDSVDTALSASNNPYENSGYEF